MLNKIFKITLATAMLIFTAASFAAPALSNLHMAKGQLPPAKNAPAKALKATAGHYYPTEITVINDVPDIVYITLPGSDIIHETMLSGDKLFFWSWDQFDFVRIVLFDFYDAVFFDGYVSNYTTLFTSDFFYSLKAKNAAKAKAAH